jgi:hypothetical protein
MSDSVLLPIPYNRLDSVWDSIKDRLQAAVESANGRFELKDAKKFLEDKDWVLWVSIRNKKIEAIAITEVLQYSKKKMCMVRIMTGENYANWIGLEDGIAKWAKSVGCDGMEAIARKGWARVMKDYEQSHVFLERMFDA